MTAVIFVGFSPLKPSFAPPAGSNATENGALSSAFSSFYVSNLDSSGGMLA